MNAYRILIPVVLGLAGGTANFLAVRGATAPVEIVVVARDLEEGTELTPALLRRVGVRADRELELSAVRFDRCGVLVGRKVNRPLHAGEVLFFRDVEDEGNAGVRGHLRPGELSRTIPMRADGVPASLRAGDEIGLLVEETPAARRDRAASVLPPTSLRLLGPYRLIGLGGKPERGRVGPAGRDGREVVVAVSTAGGNLGPDARALEEAFRAGGRIVRVEHYVKGR